MGEHTTNPKGIMATQLEYDDNAHSFKEHVMLIYDCSRPTKNDPYTQARSELNFRNSLIAVLPTNLQTLMVDWKGKNAVPATTATTSVRPQRMWTVTEATFPNIGDLAVDDGHGGAVNHPASMEHIMDAFIEATWKPHHVARSKNKVMFCEQKGRPVSKFYGLFLKQITQAGYDPDSELVIDMFKKKLDGGLARAVKNENLASLKVQMMREHPATLQEAAERAEEIEGELMEMAESCGLSHYNAAGDTSMAAAVLTREDIDPKVLREIQDETLARVKSEVAAPLEVKMEEQQSVMQTMMKQLQEGQREVLSFKSEVKDLFGELKDEIKSSSRGGRRPINCYNCGKRGHIARDCREPKRGESSEGAQQ